jgi:hypothetical protein
MSDIKTPVGAAVNEAVAVTLAGKKFWESKTFWVNMIMAGAVLVQTQYGFVIGPEIQALIISGVNLVLRKVTNQPVTW